MLCETYKEEYTTTFKDLESYKTEIVNLRKQLGTVMVGFLLLLSCLLCTKVFSISLTLWSPPQDFQPIKKYENNLLKGNIITLYKESHSSGPTFPLKPQLNLETN